MRGWIIKKITFLATFLLLFQLYNAAFSGAFDVTVLKSANIKPYNDALEGFKGACDCDVREMVLSGGDKDISRRVLNMNPDAVLAIGMDALAHAQSLKDLPVIYTMVPYFQAVNSIYENISGVSMYIPPEKYLNTMLELFPDAKRIGVIYDPKNTDEFITEAMQVAQSRGIELVARKAGRPGSVPSLIDNMKNKIDVFWMLPDATVINSETVNYMLLFSFQNRVPIFTFSKKYLEMGAVATLIIDPFDLGEQAGEIVKKLKSEKSLKTPVRITARKAVLKINRKMAKKLGVRINYEFIERAEEDVN